jgi:hypothetical protein
VFANAQEATRHFNLRYGRVRMTRTLIPVP